MARSRDPATRDGKAHQAESIGILHDLDLLFSPCSRPVLSRRSCVSKIANITPATQGTRLKKPSKHSLTQSGYPSNCDR
jgi:hypothetical protein